MSLDLIRIGLDTPADYQLGMLTIARRTAQLTHGLAGPAVILGQSRPIVTTGDQPAPVTAEPAARAGGVTYFGPGVLLVSPVVAADVNAVHEALLQAGEATCADHGLQIVRRPHYPGLWVAAAHSWRKVASIGLYHEGPMVTGGGGLALNVSQHPAAFDGFDACGIPDVAMTSLAAETGQPLTVAAVADTIAAHLEQLLTPLLMVPTTA